MADAGRGAVGVVSGYVERHAPVGPAVVVGRSGAVCRAGRALARGRRRGGGLVCAEQVLELGAERGDGLL